MTLFKHEMRQGRKTVMIWTIAISFFLVVSVLIYPEMKGQLAQATSMFKSMGAFSSAFGMDTMDFGSIKGYYGTECGNVLGLGGALFAALIGIAMLAKEEKDGTAEFLLTHPLNRAEAVTAKLAAVLAEVTVMNLTVFLISALSLAAIGEAVFWKELILLHTAYWLMQVEIACVCFGISAVVRRGGLGIGLGLAIGLYFMNLIANLTTQAKWLKYITPFGYCDSADILAKSAIHTGRLLAGAGFILAGVALAYWKYCRKDIR